MNWAAVVPYEDMAVERVDNFTADVSLPSAALAGYDITTPETIGITVPGAAYCNVLLCSTCPCNVLHHELPDLTAPPLLITADGASASATLSYNGVAVQPVGTIFNCSASQLRAAGVVSLTLSLHAGERWSDTLVDELLPSRTPPPSALSSVAVRLLAAFAPSIPPASGSAPWYASQPSGSAPWYASQPLGWAQLVTYASRAGWAGWGNRDVRGTPPCAGDATPPCAVAATPRLFLPSALLLLTRLRPPAPSLLPLPCPPLSVALPPFATSSPRPCFC
jgi:hypothetical protein